MTNRICKYLIAIAVACLLVSNPPTHAAEEHDEPYVPGSEDIEVDSFLRRIEREIGQPLTPDTPPAEDSATRAATREVEEGPRSFPIVIRLKDNTRVSGRFTTGEPQVTIVSIEGDVETVHNVHLDNIRSLTIETWAAQRLLPTANGEKRIYYFPSSCVLIKKNGQKVRGRLQSRDWLQINLQTEERSGQFRTYFTETRSVPAPAEGSTLEAMGTPNPEEVPEQIVVQVTFEEAPENEMESATNTTH